MLPLFDILEDIPNSVHLFLFYTSLIGLFSIIFFPRNTYVLSLTIMIELFSCLLDQNRWQPWEYQYLLTVLFLFIFRNNPKQFVNYFIFLLAVTYIYSGLHKINGGFLVSIWEGLILKRFFGFSSSNINNLWIHYLGLSLGLIEFLLGIGLIFLKSKKIIAIMLIVMHLFILVLFSPIGVNSNSIIWPWNVAMILFLYAIFIYQSDNEFSPRNLIQGYNKIIFLLIGVLPILNFFGYWDDYLSFSLYSGKSKHLEICITKNANMPEYQKFVSKKSRLCNSGLALNCTTWSLKELNVPLYPEKRIFKKIVKNWKKKHPDIATTFYYYKYPYQSKDIHFYN